MRTKVNDLALALNCSDFFAIILVESWLNDSFTDDELNLENYNIFRCDRSSASSNKVRGGGILIAVRKMISAYRIKPIDENVEQLFVSCNIGNCNFILGGVYIPPSSSDQIYHSHVSSLERIRLKYPSHNFYIFGDYNIPNLHWFNGNFRAREEQHSASLIITQGYTFLDFSQHINIPNSNNVFLDLLFSNDPDILVTVPVDYIFPSSLHHEPYSFEIPWNNNTKQNTIDMVDYFYDFRNADYVGLNNYLSPIKWLECLDFNDINNATASFYDILNMAIALFVPVKRYKSSNFPDWFNSELRNLVYQKKIAHKRYKTKGDITYYYEFTNLRSQCKIMAKVCYENYVRNMEGKLQADPRSFWKFFNKKNSVFSVPNQMFLNDKEANNGREVVEVFSDYFASVYVDDHENNLYRYKGQVNNYDINCPKFSVSDIFNKISKIPDKLNLGPDGIPNVLIKNCLYSLSQPLTLLFNNSMLSGVFPEIWKNSYVIPVFKSGDRANVTNYRGVCNQSAIPKLYDNLVYDSLNFQCKELVSDHQHGFMQNKSTITNLLIYETDIIRALEDGCQVDAIYTDFSKAFDRVNHHKLLNKLDNIGFNYDLIKWFSSMLIGRTQRVKIGSFISDIIEVKSGVPQGSHCAPLLFNLFINDIGHNFNHCKFLLFADDMKMYMPVNSYDDQLRFQEDIDTLLYWCNFNKLHLNIDKCYSISFFKMNKKHNSAYSIDNSRLKNVSSVKDLGVVIDENLTFVEHINYVTSKASRFLGYILRNCQSFSIETVKTVYMSLVVSHLEYASIIWSPLYVIHQTLIERVQNRFLRFCAYKLNYNVTELNHEYSGILNDLQMPTLKNRRTYLELCFIYKLLNNLIICPSLIELIKFHVPNRSLRNNYLFHIDHHSSNYGIHAPLVRTLSLLNDIDIDLFCHSLYSFKKCIKSIIFVM